MGDVEKGKSGRNLECVVRRGSMGEGGGERWVKEEDVVVEVSGSGNEEEEEGGGVLKRSAERRGRRAVMRSIAMIGPAVMVSESRSGKARADEIGIASSSAAAAGDANGGTTGDGQQQQQRATGGDTSAPINAPSDPISMSPSVSADANPAKTTATPEKPEMRIARKKPGFAELESVRAELEEKELLLLSQSKELLQKEQTVLVLQERLEIEQRLRELLVAEKEKALEEAALARGFCGVSRLAP